MNTNKTYRKCLVCKQEYIINKPIVKGETKGQKDYLYGICENEKCQRTYMQHVGIEQAIIEEVIEMNKEEKE